MLTALIFIAVLAVLVLGHEFGHYVAARRSGMRVLEFGFGLPPRAVGWKRVGKRWRRVSARAQDTDDDATIYSLNYIPFGGFVRIFGENGEEGTDARAFNRRPWWPRVATLAAGVFMNVVIAFALYTVLFTAGLPAGFASVDDVPAGATLAHREVFIGMVQPSSTSASAGLKVGDVVTSIDGTRYTDGADMRTYVLAHAGKTFAVEIRRGSERIKLDLPSKGNLAPGEGATGLLLGTGGQLRYPWYLAPAKAAELTVTQIGEVFNGLYRIVTGNISLKQVGGPVQIARLTGEARSLGWQYVVQLAAFLSLNLAVLNILPLPALDGGRIALLVVEKLRRKPLSQRLEQKINGYGFAFLLALMLLVTVKDIVTK